MAVAYVQLTAVIILAALSLTGADLSLPRGLFALGDRVNGSLVSLPSFTQGVTVRLNWAKVQPAVGTFNWTELDASIAQAAAAGLQVQIGIQPGVVSPEFVYTEGAAKFQMLWDLPFGFKNCTFVHFPVPWDPVYLHYWSTFVEALADRYDDNPTVVAVKVAGINAQTTEIVVPAKNVSVCSHNQWDPTAEWQRVGYTPGRITQTFARILSVYKQAFKNTSLVLMTGNWSWPGIDNDGHITGNLDWNMSQALLFQYAEAVQGLGGATVANNGMSAWYKWAPPAGLPPTAIGSQALWRIVGDTTCRMDGGHHPCPQRFVLNRTLQNCVNRNVSYFEIYLPDLLNPGFEDLLKAYAARFPGMRQLLH